MATRPPTLATLVISNPSHPISFYGLKNESLREALQVPLPVAEQLFPSTIHVGSVLPTLFADLPLLPPSRFASPVRRSWPGSLTIIPLRRPRRPHQQEKFSYFIFLVRAKNKKSSGAQRPNKPPLQRPYTGWRYDGLLPSET